MTGLSADKTGGENRPIPIRDPEGMLCPASRWEYRIHDGFWLSMLDVAPRKDLSFAYEKDGPTFNFGFFLAGNYTNRVALPGLYANTFANSAGGSGILYIPHQQGVLDMPAQPRVRIFHIHLAPSAFYDLFYPERDTLPKDLKPLLEASSNKAYAFRSGMSVEMRAALERLVCGPAQGAPARLFYQAIAFELLAGQIARANCLSHAGQGVDPDERDRVVRARDMLVRDLAAPPGLKQLARETGLNMNKLQQGFHQLYGASVFQYFQSYRMNEANRLFHETRMNVSQAAFAVGYTNVSHFSRAYKKHFNILPKKHLALIRN